VGSSDRYYLSETVERCLACEADRVATVERLFPQPRDEAENRAHLESLANQTSSKHSRGCRPRRPRKRSRSTGVENPSLFIAQLALLARTPGEHDR